MRRTGVVALLVFSMLLGLAAIVHVSRQGFGHPASLGFGIVMLMLLGAVAIPLLLDLRRDQIPIRRPSHGRYFRSSGAFSISLALAGASLLLSLGYWLLDPTSAYAPVFAGGAFAMGGIGLMYAHRFGYFVDENEPSDADGDPTPYRY